MIDLNIFEFAKISAFFIFILILPGFLFLNIFFKRLVRYNFLELIPISFCFSLLTLALIGFPAYIFRFSQSTFLYLGLGIFSFLTIANLYLFLTGKRKFNLRKMDKSGWMAMIFVVLVLIELIMLSGAYIYGDRISHTGIMRRLAVAPNIFPEFTLFKDVPGKIEAAYGYNIWHLAGSIFVRYLSIDPNLIWKYLVIIIAPLQLLSFYFLSRRFSTKSPFILIALVVYFLLNGIINYGWEWRLSPYPDQIARNIMMPIILGFILILLRSKKINWKIIVTISLFGASIFLIHLFSVVYLASLLIGLAIFGFVLAKKYQFSKKILLTLGSWAVISAPLIYYKIGPYHQIIPNRQIIPTNFSSSDNQFVYFGKYFIINPQILLSFWIIFPVLVSITLILWRLLIVRQKISPGFLMILNLTFAPLLISFTPPVATYLGSIITSTYLARLMSIIPTVLILSLFLYEIVKKYRLSLAWMALTLFLLALLGFGFEGANLRSDLKKSFTQPMDTLYHSSACDYINNSVPANSVVAADTQNSLFFFACTDNNLVMLPWGHCPAVVDKKERLDDVSKFFSSDSIELSEISKIIKKYQIDYIYGGNYEMDKFEQNPKNFIKIKEFNEPNSYAAIYKVRDFSQ